MTAVHVHRRKTDPLPPWHMRLWLEVTNPLRDRPGAGFSMTKMIAAWFAYWVGYSIGQQHGIVTWNTLILAFLSGAMAFGKSVMNHLIEKLTISGVSTQSDARSLDRTEVDVNINETRRLTEERHVEDGSPPRSMPPVGVTEPE